MKESLMAPQKSAGGHGEDTARQSEMVILGLAGLLAGGAAGDGKARAFAQERGWIGADGNLTEAGYSLAKALAEQAGTRSAFRGF
jgi:hypothetical protein